MNISHIKNSDWRVFEERFPDATAYLLSCGLKNEYLHLQSIDNKNDWEQSRLKELDNLFGEQSNAGS